MYTLPIASTNDADSKKRPSMQHLTIDREQEIYLRRGGLGREAWGDLGITYYLLYFKGCRIYFSVLFESNSVLYDRERKISAYTLSLTNIVIPKEFDVSKESILLLPKDAIQVHECSELMCEWQRIIDFKF
ncbi:MAG: hypothetical protein VXW65_09850 [Pseudomonadota bacterium]|nr:hypothetical protein [Pseudomonadota bacterium]